MTEFERIYKLQPNGEWAWETQVAAGGGGAQSGVQASADILFTEPTSAGTAYPIIAVDVDAETITIAGDHVAAFADTLGLEITGSTGNDGVWGVISAVLDGGSTVITIDGDLTDATVDGAAIAAMTLTASVQVPAGSVVLDVYSRCLVPWTQPIVGYTLGDADVPNGYSNGNSLAAGPAFNPLDIAGSAGGYTTLKLNADGYYVAAQGVQASPGVIGATNIGVRYAEDAVITAVLTLIPTSDVDPPGQTLVKILYFANVDPVVAT